MSVGFGGKSLDDAFTRLVVSKEPQQHGTTGDIRQQLMNEYAAAGGGVPRGWSHGLTEQPKIVSTGTPQVATRGTNQGMEAYNRGISQGMMTFNPYLTPRGTSQGMMAGGATPAISPLQTQPPNMRGRNAGLGIQNPAAQMPSKGRTDGMRGQSGTDKVVSKLTGCGNCSFCR